MEQINDYLNEYVQGSLTTISSDITDMLFTWVVIPSIAFMLIILVIFVYRTIRHRKVENAIFEIRDILKASTPPTQKEPDNQ